MLKITTPLIRTTVLAALVGTFAYASPVHAATSNVTTTTTTEDQDSSAAPAAAPATAPATKSSKAMESVETRIQTLHDKLKITSDQEADWAKVAQTMRDNEANIHQLIQERHQNPDEMSAIDDLKSYAKITQAHADGLQKLTDSFETVYNDMSDDQKKNADEVFGKFEGHRGAKAMHHKKTL